MRAMFGSRSGQIRCPTCHRSTPPDEFCAKCGSPIPPGVRNRPRGLTREELQARIRARRLGLPNVRRGSAAEPTPPAAPGDDEAEQPWADRWAGEPDLPRARVEEPRPERPAEDEGTARWTPAPPVPAPLTPAPRTPLPSAPVPYERAQLPPSDHGLQPSFAANPVREYAEERRWDDQGSADDANAEITNVRYEVDDRRRTRPGPPRRASGSPVLVAGLLVLGALALLGGAVLAGMIGRDENVAVGPTPTPQATESPGPGETAAAEESGTPSPGATAGPSGGPVVFPDGFTAEAEPCLVEPASGPTCPVPGDVVTAENGSLWILVRFENIKSGDVIAATGTTEDGESIGQGGWDATFDGNGWSYFAFILAGLPEGEYEVTVTRNEQPAAVTTFRLES